VTAYQDNPPLLSVFIDSKTFFGERPGYPSECQNSVWSVGSVTGLTESSTQPSASSRFTSSARSHISTLVMWLKSMFAACIEVGDQHIRAHGFSETEARDYIRFCRGGV